MTKMQKSDKIFIHNTNMLFALGGQIQVGTVRECFVVSQLGERHSVGNAKKSKGAITYIFTARYLQ